MQIAHDSEVTAKGLFITVKRRDGTRECSCIVILFRWSGAAREAGAAQTIQQSDGEWRQQLKTVVAICLFRFPVSSSVSFCLSIGISVFLWCTRWHIEFSLRCHLAQNKLSHRIILTLQALYVSLLFHVFFLIILVLSDPQFMSFYVLCVSQYRWQHKCSWNALSWRSWLQRFTLKQQCITVYNMYK